jgi:hypothetical protein
MVILFSQSHIPCLSCSPRATHLGFLVLAEPHTLVFLFSQSHTPKPRRFCLSGLLRCVRSDLAVEAAVRTCVRRRSIVGGAFWANLLTVTVERSVLFIMTPSTLPLSHRNPASSGYCLTAAVRRVHDKRYTLYFVILLTSSVPFSSVLHTSTGTGNVQSTRVPLLSFHLNVQDVPSY